MLSRYAQPLCSKGKQPYMEVFYPQWIRRNTVRQRFKTINAIPGRKFVQIQKERMITGYTGRIKITTDVFIPTGNAPCMRFEAERIQFPPAHRCKRLSSPICRTVFGFFRQQIITKIVGRLQEAVYLIRQTNRCGLYTFRNRMVCGTHNGNIRVLHNRFRLICQYFFFFSPTLKKRGNKSH